MSRMTTLERNFPPPEINPTMSQKCSGSRQRLLLFSDNIFRLPASCGIYETVARVTLKTGLCDVNVIQSDTLCNKTSKMGELKTKATNET